jgi:hypothetical protein
VVDWIQGFLGRIEVLVQVLGVVGGLFFVVYTAIKSKGQFIPIITTMITVAVFIWGLFNIDWFTDKLSNDSTSNGRQVDTGRFSGTMLRPGWLGTLSDGRELRLAPTSPWSGR